MGNSIKPHVERAEKTGVCQLVHSGLEKFPADLLRLTANLRTLDLSQNKLVVLPGVIGEFKLLKSLVVNGNRLTSVPMEIGNLKKLETLSLSGNRMSALPDTIGELSALKTLNVNGNSLRSLPVGLWSLAHLDVIDISKNRLTDLPRDIASTSAVEIIANDNQIAAISEEGLVGCRRLKVLRLEENCLSLSKFTPRLLKESQISLLTVEGNVFNMKDFHQLDGYEQYMSRYTATKRKVA